MLIFMIGHTKLKCQIEGVNPHLVDGGISIAQYTDDTVLFMDNNLGKAKI
jgi:hypothetical protein